MRYPQPIASGNRKFTLALLIVTVASLLVILDEMTGRQWVEIAGATMLFFGASNVGEHMMTKSKTESG